MEGIREAWTKGPGGRGDQPWWLTSETSTTASVHGSDRVDRVKTADVRVERGSGGLSRRSIEDGGDTCRVAGTCMEYATAAVWGFGPQNHRVDGFTGLSLKTRTEVLRRNGRHVAASRSSRRDEANS
jgi:hypothetical protein